MFYFDKWEGKEEKWLYNLGLVVYGVIYVMCMM